MKVSHLTVGMLVLAGALGSWQSAFGTLTSATNNNITLANSQVEVGGDGTDNPNVVNGAVGALVPYTATGTFSVDGSGGTFGVSNLNDGDVGDGNLSDGFYALPDNSTTLTLAFGGSQTLGSIAIYNGYGNRDDGAYELRDGSNTLLGTWSISPTGSTLNDGVDSFWLAFNTPVTTTELRLFKGTGDASASYREVQVFAPVPEPAALGLLTMGVIALVRLRRKVR